VKLLIDEQTPVQYRDVLAFLLPGHEVAHVNDLRWKSKKDAALLADAVRRGFNVFLTNDIRQLEDPDEIDAIRRSGIHHVRYRVPRARTVTLAHLGLALGAVAAAMPLVIVDLAKAEGQRLVLIKGVSTAPADRYEALDPRRTPPRYWKPRYWN
jgi:PIN like domain